MANGNNGQGWAGYGIVQNTTGTVSLIGGQFYPITIGFDQGNGGYGLEAFMATPGNTLTVGQAGTFLPVANLFTTNPTNTFSNALVVSGTSARALNEYVSDVFPSMTIGASGPATLSVTGGPAYASFTTTAISNGPTFNPQGSNVLNLGTISVTDTNGFNVAGSGTTVVAGNNTTNIGRVTIGGNLVALQQSGNPASGPLGTAPITLSNGTLILANTSTTTTIFDAIGGNPITLAAGTNDSIIAGSTVAGVPGGSVTLGGAGTLAIPSGVTLNLGYANGYSLGFGGAFQLGNSGAISAAAGSNVVLPAANLSYAGGTFSAASGGTLTMANTMSTGTYSPANGGVVVLTGYTGPLANLVPQSGGILAIESNTSAGTLNIQTGIFAATSNTSFGPATLSFNGGYLGADTAVTLANPLTFGANPTLNFTGASAVNLSASPEPDQLRHDVQRQRSKLGGHAVWRDQRAGHAEHHRQPHACRRNSYSGGTTINSGAYPIVTNAFSLGSGPITFNNGGLQASTAVTGLNALANPWTIPAGDSANFTGTNAIQLSGSTSLTGTAYVNINNPNLTVVLSGPISGNGALIRATDTAGQFNGTLVINNPNSTFSGGFTLQSYGGYVDVQGASSTGPAGSPTSGPFGTGRLTIGSANNGYIGVLNSGAAATIANPITMIDGSAYTSAEGLTFTGPVTLSGAGDGASQMEFWLGTNSNIAFTGAIGGSLGIDVRQGSGSGGLTLSGPSTYTGATTITMGSLIAGNSVYNSVNGPFGNSSGAVVIGTANSGGNPAALLLGGPLSLGYGVEFDRPVTVNASAGPTTIGDITVGDAALTGDNTVASGGFIPAGSGFTGVITLDSNVTLTAAAGGSVTFGAVNPNNGQQGYITGTGGINVAAAPSGNVSLINTNSYTGATQLTSGQLTLDYSFGAVGGIVPPTSPVILAGGTLVFNGNPNVAVNETFASTTISGFGPVVTANPNGDPLNGEFGPHHPHGRRVGSTAELRRDVHHHQ